MDMKFLAAAASAALLVGASQASAAIILIDNFNDDQEVSDAPTAVPAIPTNSQVGPSGNIIGGYRDLLVETDGSGVGDTTLQADSGELSFSNDDDETGRGWVTYDGSNEVGADPTNIDITGLGGLDLFDGAGAGFQFEILRADANIFVRIDVFDQAGGMSFYEETVPEGGGAAFIPFAAFSGDVDFNNVGALQFFAQSGEDSDIISLDGALGSITVDTGVIPVPAAGLLLLGGLGGLSAFGMRRKRS